jgi:AcrR family transcriptional regulator
MTQTRQRLTAVERRQAVLDTACRVFSAASYRGATTAEIAEAAEISEPILYRHFGSKRELFLACLDEAWQRFRAAADEAIASDPHGCLGKISDAYMASKTRVRLVDLWIQAVTVAPEDQVIAKALKKQMRDVHAFFADVLRAAQERGEVPRDRDPVAEAWLFVAGGLLVTFDQRLGGMLGDDFARVRAERRRWMLGEETN